MTDPTRPAPVSGYPAQPTDGYPQHPPPPQQPNYYYPDPNQNPNQQYYPPPPPPPRTIFYRRVMSALILTFIILAIILFIIYLILRPRVPIFTLTALSLSSLNLTTSPPSSLSATWTATFQVTNPNTKLHAYYDEIEARVFYDRSLLAINQLPPFDQPVRDQTDITARLTAASAYVEPDLGREFSDDRSKGNIKFDVHVVALVRFKAGGWRARRRWLRAFCDDLIVSVNGTSGGLSGGPRRCAVAI